MEVLEEFAEAVKDAASRAQVSLRPWYVLECDGYLSVRPDYSGAWTRAWVVGSDLRAVAFEPDFCFRVWYRNGTGILIEARNVREARRIGALHARSAGTGSAVRLVEEL